MEGTPAAMGAWADKAIQPLLPNIGSGCGNLERYRDFAE